MPYRFRWVFCQLDALQHCIPPNLRQYLNELPETLDETYERILKGINKSQKDNAHRLLQCLTVAVRPLLVEELAELLAFDFEASSSGEIPTLKEDWRWDDEEEAVLSTCSSLITIIPRDDTRVVQFSHFSVKEYLTSSRLAKSPHGEVSRFRIDLEPAHTSMVQACLATLLRQDEHAGIDAKTSPLLKYAARHWVDHAQFERVSSRVQGGMDDLFDSSKPHFAAWLRVYNIDEAWDGFYSPIVGTPLYFASFCGFYALAEHLIIRHPQQVNAFGGLNIFPLLAALYKGHFHVANLLYRHGAVVDVKSIGGNQFTPLCLASCQGEVDIMRWLLDHGADTNSGNIKRFTPLHYAASAMQPEAVHFLLEHNADINSQDTAGVTPLNWVVSERSWERKFMDMVRRLLEHGADPNIGNNDHRTPIHEALSQGLLEVARLLLIHGAKVDEKDGEGKTPYQLATSDEMTKLLLEHGAVPRT